MSQLTERIRDAFRSNIDSKMESVLIIVSKIEVVIAAHRRFHDKAGCPGRPDCYVCAEEEWFETHDSICRTDCGDGSTVYDDRPRTGAE